MAKGVAVRVSDEAIAEKAEAKGPSRPVGEVVMEVDSLHVFYGAVEALKGISFNVREGEGVRSSGSKGAGKTATRRAVSGVSELYKTVRGRISSLGDRVESWAAHKIARDSTRSPRIEMRPRTVL